MPPSKVGCICTIIYLHYELLFLTLFKAHFLLAKKRRYYGRRELLGPGSMTDVFVHRILPAAHSQQYNVPSNPNG